MILRVLKTVRTALRSRVVAATALCGIIAVLAGSLYAAGGHPAFAALSLALLTLVALTAVSQLVGIRWLQETEARNASSRFRELRELVGTTSAPGHQGRTPAHQGRKVVASPASRPPAAAAAAQGGRAIGRLAAAVEVDHQRQDRIHRYLGAPPTAPWGGRVIYSIVGQELDRHLGDAHALEPLRPSTIAAQIAVGNGTALVLDDRAFTAGIWYGADSAVGTLLANEVLQALAACRSAGTPVYFVRTRRESNIYTPAYEAASDVVFSGSSSMGEWAEDYKFGLLGSLETFAKIKQGALIGSH